MVDAGMDEEAIVERFREAGRSAAVVVDQMFATGNAGDLRALGREPPVQSVFLKPPSGSLNR
jgi:hypothetical protein